jgi:hypothetical protein
MGSVLHETACPTTAPYPHGIPESLQQAAKRIAAAYDTTMNQFFVVAIAEKSAPWRPPNSSNNVRP